MYKCSGCKRQFDGEPIMSNATGKYCQTCENTRKQRMMQALQRKHELLNGRCIWCNDMTEAENNRDHICRRCKSGRTWLLKCIRHSDKAAKYAAAREVEEAPAREVRIKASYEKTKVAANGQSVSLDAESRLSRMEQMMEKLMKALGE